jgi:hypothetical protein
MPAPKIDQKTNEKRRSAPGPGSRGAKTRKGESFLARRLGPCAESGEPETAVTARAAQQNFASIVIKFLFFF